MKNHKCTILLIFAFNLTSCQHLGFKKSKAQDNKTDLADSSTANRSIAMGTGVVAKGVNLLRNQFSKAGGKAIATGKATGKVVDELKMGEDIENYMRSAFGPNNKPRYYVSHAELERKLQEDLSKKWADVVRVDLRNYLRIFRKRPELLDFVMEEGRYIQSQMNQEIWELGRIITAKWSNISGDDMTRRYQLLKQHQEEFVQIAYMKLEKAKFRFRNNIHAPLRGAHLSLELKRINNLLSSAKSNLASLRVEMGQMSPNSSAYKRAKGQQEEIVNQITRLERKIWDLEMRMEF